jgi:hypothetical protein
LLLVYGKIAAAKPSSRSSAPFRALLEFSSGAAWSSKSFAPDKKGKHLHVRGAGYGRNRSQLFNRFGGDAIHLLRPAASHTENESKTEK